MGVLRLMDFIKTKFPKAIQIKKVQDYNGKTIAIDTSNWIYQFLIKTQTIKYGSVNTPTDWMGNQTGHLIGMLSRVAHCFQNNITSIWVFDGKPPQEKYQQIKRRRKIKEQAQQKKQQAIQQGQTLDLLKMSKRSITITRQQKQSAQKLIQLIGVPMVQSPSEAEPQCAEIVKQGLAYGAVSQDMDTLAFGCQRLIRYFNQEQICQIQLQTLLKQSKLTYDQFVDMCILCGCDYTSRIRNIGAVKAYSYIKTYDNIDNLLVQIAKDDKMYKRHTYQDDFNHYTARKIFKKPQVKKIEPKDLQKGEFKQAELRQFLRSKQFSEVRVNNWLSRIRKTDYFRDL